MQSAAMTTKRIPPADCRFSGSSEYQTDDNGNYRRIDRLFVAHKADPKNRQLIKQRIVAVDGVPEL